MLFLAGLSVGVAVGFVLRIMDEENERRLGRGRRG